MTKTACQAENPGMRPSRFTVFRQKTVRDFRINKESVPVFFRF